MTKDERELHEHARRLLAALRDAPELDHRISEKIKQNYLLEGEMHRKHLIQNADQNDISADRKGRFTFPIQLSTRMARILAVALVTLLILVGSSVTVFAAQGSLPGEPLYFIKSISEDIRLSLTTSPQEKLNLTLQYNDRRMSEISTLVATGKAVPEKMSKRFTGALEDALVLASQMDDAGLQKALGKINRNAESQGTTVEELIDNLPDQAEPAIVHLQQRLHEQVILSEMGKEDLKEFREYIRQRYLKGHGRPTSTPNLSGTASPDKPGKDKENNGKGQPTHVPEPKVTPPGQDKSKDK